MVISTPDRKRPTVCVLGSANMDLVVNTARAPRPGETVTGTQFAQIPGGKGANQALAAARAGGNVRMIGAVGDDAFGDQIRTTLEADGVDTSELRVVGEPTGTAHITVSGDGENSIVVVPGANGTLRNLTADHRAAIATSDVLMVQLELPLPLVQQAATFAAGRGVRVVLTPAPVVPLPANLMGVVELLVPNEHEAIQLTGATDAESAARQLLENGVRAVAITLGRRGCLYAAGPKVLHVPGLQVTAVDTTAAGDTFVAALTVALGEGRDERAALAWATAAAALSVQRRGASSSMPYRSEIDDQLASSQGAG